MPTLKPVPAPENDPAPARRGFLRRLLREWVLPIGAVVAVMAPIRASIADWNDVPSGSMRPTILEGDRIYVNKLAFGLRVPFTNTWLATWGEPERGDIVTFASPADGTRLVKRIIGVPGDRVAMIDNRVIVNGHAAAYSVTDPNAAGELPDGRPAAVVLVRETLPGREHAIAVTPGIQSLSTFSETIVPEGHYFVLGDNRDQSNDSRFIGLVPRSSIYGRSGFVALSLDTRHGFVPRWDRWFSALK